MLVLVTPTEDWTEEGEISGVGVVTIVLLLTTEGVGVIELTMTGVSLKNGLMPEPEPDPTSSGVGVGVAVIKDVNIVEGDGVICPIELVAFSVTLDVTATVLLTRGVLGVIL